MNSDSLRLVNHGKKGSNALWLSRFTQQSIFDGVLVEAGSRWKMMSSTY